VYCRHIYPLQNSFFAFSLFFVCFLWCFMDPIRIPGIENLVPRIRETCHRVPKIRENRIPRIREIGSLQVHTGYLRFAKKTDLAHIFFAALIVFPNMFSTKIWVSFSSFAITFNETKLIAFKRQANDLGLWCFPFSRKQLKTFDGSCKKFQLRWTAFVIILTFSKLCFNIISTKIVWNNVNTFWKDLMNSFSVCSSWWWPIYVIIQTYFAHFQKKANYWRNVWFRRMFTEWCLHFTMFNLCLHSNNQVI